jgi:hypothetical protein
MAVSPDDLDKFSTGMTRVSQAHEIVQKAILGQPVDVIYTATSPGNWTASLPSLVKPEFAPRVVPAAGRGTTWLVRSSTKAPIAVGRHSSLDGSKVVRLVSDSDRETFKHLGTASKTLSGAATAAGIYSCASGQWTDDKSRGDLTTGERLGRAAVRTTAEQGLGMAGGIGGRWAGAAYGGLVGGILGPPGAAVGALVGGIGGGVGGGKLGGMAGSKMADEKIDEIGESIGEVLDQAGEKLGELRDKAGEAIDNAAEAVFDAYEEMAEAVCDACEEMGDRVRRFFRGY